MGNVISIAHRFKDKKNREYDPIIAEKIDELKGWFQEQWPEAELVVQFIFSRIVGEELEIKREIVYKNRGTRHTLTSTTGIHRHTWTSSFLMYKFLDAFVEEQKKAITGIMNVSKRSQ